MYGDSTPRLAKCRYAALPSCPYRMPNFDCTTCPTCAQVDVTADSCTFMDDLKEKKRSLNIQELKRFLDALPRQVLVDYMRETYGFTGQSQPIIAKVSVEAKPAKTRSSVSKRHVKTVKDKPAVNSRHEWLPRPEAPISDSCVRFGLHSFVPFHNTRKMGREVTK